MSRVLSPSTNRTHGVAMVSRLWRVGRATVYRHRTPVTAPRRPGPVGPMPDEALVAAIRELLAQGPSTAKATERSGPGSASPAFAPPSAGSCG